MTRATIGRRLQYRLGVVYTGDLIGGGGRTLRWQGRVVGWRIGRRGWTVMPLQHLAEYRGPKLIDPAQSEALEQARLAVFGAEGQR
jgi:hypothetical protein